MQCNIKIVCHAFVCLSVCVVGAQLSAFHGLLRQSTQRQEAHLALSPVQRRTGYQLLQKQVRHWTLSPRTVSGVGSLVTVDSSVLNALSSSHSD